MLAKAGRAFTKHPIQVLEDAEAQEAACAEVGHALAGGWALPERDGVDEEHDADRTASVSTAPSTRTPAFTGEF
ncbi:MAG TPA: hypothetical protein VIX84_12645 [Acidimicrobiales bacterium]